MDINSLFPSIKERAKSPLYGSFIISWLLWNWKIVLGFIFLLFRGEDILNDDIIHAISTLGWVNALIGPLGLALVYIFALPFIDMLIFKFSETKKREKMDEKIRIGRRHSVEGDLYYDLKLDFEKEKKKVISFETEKKDWLAEKESYSNGVQELRGKLDSAQGQLNKANERLSQLQQRHDITKIMQGRWTLNIKRRGDPSESRTEIDIVNAEYYEIQGTFRKLKYNLDMVDFDRERKKLNFVKYTPKEERPEILFNKLTVIDNDTLEGYENLDFQVFYKRQELKDDKSVISNYIIS